MIEIVIKAKDCELVYHIDSENYTLEEKSVVLYRLEQIKLLLLSKEFKEDFNVEREEDENKEM